MTQDVASVDMEKQHVLVEVGLVLFMVLAGCPWIFEGQESGARSVMKPASHETIV